MCIQTERCAFYIKHKDTRNDYVKSLIARYCEQPDGFRLCRRLLIDQYYNVDLNPAVGPAGDFLEYR